MELEKQVISLEYAKRLKELGISQQSLFHWLRLEDNTRFIFNEETQTSEKSEVEYRYCIGNPYCYYIPPDDTWSAFTVSELGDLLPIDVVSYKNMNAWQCSRFYAFKDPYFFDETEANVKAKFLIYLIENKLL